MNSTEYQMYDLGRQAREAGFETCSCNLISRYKIGFWMAGWHDKDMEMGNSKYFDNKGNRVYEE